MAGLLNKQSTRAPMKNVVEYYYPAEAPGLCCEYQFYAAFRGSGESGYSLGQPPEDASVEVIGINTDDGKNVLPWLESFGFCVEELAERILACHGDGAECREYERD